MELRRRGKFGLRWASLAEKLLKQRTVGSQERTVWASFSDRVALWFACEIAPRECQSLVTLGSVLRWIRLTLELTFDWMRMRLLDLGLLLDDLSEEYLSKCRTSSLENCHQKVKLFDQADAMDSMDWRGWMGSMKREVMHRHRMIAL